MATTVIVPKIFWLLKDPAWDGLKPDKIHLFPKSYSTDDSAQLITDVSNEGLEYMKKKLIYDEEFTFFYWTYEPKGSFIDSFVTADLVADARAFADFRTWFEQTVSAWCNANGLKYKIERDKLLPVPDFYIKITITVPATVTT